MAPQLYNKKSVTFKNVLMINYALFFTLTIFSILGPRSNVKARVRSSENARTKEVTMVSQLFG